MLKSILQKGLSFVILAVISQVAYGQISIEGTVTTALDGSGLPGVNVVVQGTTEGTLTDISGHYRIEVAEENAVLVFSYIGYVSETVSVGGKSTIDVAMVEDVTELNEIVVIGYGTQTKKEVTGAVSSLKNEDMVNIAASDFTKTLQGQMAGVSVTESSGRPGDQAIIQIRGLGSINGSSNPLYVVDGIPYQGNPNIPSEDIESVEVLKDGAAAAVYGTRASNGVIIITTKRGKAGQTKIGFSAYYGVQNITSGTPLLSTPEHIYVDEMRSRADGGNSSILYYNPNAMDYDTDFVGAIVNDNAPIQNYNLTLNGGKDNLTFNLSSTYFNQDGVLINSGYDRFSTRANAGFKKGIFDAFVSVGVQNSNKEVEPWALYEFAIFQGPYRPPLGDLPTTDNSVIIPGNNPDHVGYFSRLLDNTDDRKDDSYNVAGNFKIDIVKGLKYQLNLGANKYNYKRKFWQPQYLVYDEDGDLNELGSRRDAILNEEYINSRKVTAENILSYDATFGDHKLGLLAGYMYEQYDYEYVTVEKRDFISNDIQVFNGGSELTRIGGSNLTNVLIGKLFRAQYNYKEKYLLSASIRHDGSSKFGESKRYSWFPGVSAGWNISEEGFMSSVGSVSGLKLRASYAGVGNEGIDPYLYAGFIDTNIDYVWGPEGGDVLDRGAIQRGYANPIVGWESNIAKNIGIDLLMFDGKFSFTADIYHNSKEDMLLNVLLPASTGTNVPNDWNNTYKTQVSNVGDMVNQGIEIASYYKQTSANGLDWKITGVFTKNENKIANLGDLSSIPMLDSKPGLWRANQQDVTTYMRPDYPAGAFFLIPTDGIIKTQEELDVVQAYMPNARLGDLIYIDQNGDGQLNDDDRVYQGTGMPKFETGLKFDLNYKGFDFNTFLFYSHQNKVFNGSKLFAYSMSRHKDLYYMWTAANPGSDVMSARGNSEHDNFRSRSDYFLEDGTFFRVRTLSLGYTFPDALFNNKIDKMRLYVTGQNLFTVTNYEGYDPEVGGNGVSTRGIDKGSYPVSRMVMLGLQLEF